MSNLPVSMDYAALIRSSRRLEFPANAQKIRIALLLDAATRQLCRCCGAFSTAADQAAIYEGPFDAIQLETVDSNSGLYRFQPDIIVLLNSVQALRTSFSKRAGYARDFSGKIRPTASGVGSIKAAPPQRFCSSTFTLPYERHFGNFERKTTDSLTSIVHSLNGFIAEQARERAGILLNDVDWVASWIGRQYWFDERFGPDKDVLCSRTPASGCQEHCGYRDVYTGTRGQVCHPRSGQHALGRVIGDDGLDGIVLSAHGDGEAYYRLQLS